MPAMQHRPQNGIDKLAWHMPTLKQQPGMNLLFCWTLTATAAVSAEHAIARAAMRALPVIAAGIPLHEQQSG